MTVYDVFLKAFPHYTDIQKLALPIISMGVNCLVVAPTGSGKTEAALLPVLDSMLRSGKQDGIQALYITPMRALNRDMIKRMEGICRAVGITVAVRHGDTLQKERSRQSRKAPMLLITTPETLQSILPTKYMGRALGNVRHVIVDEVHELYYNKRGVQLSMALERLEEKTPGFQRIGVSATISDTEAVKLFLCGSRPCESAVVGRRKDLAINISMPRRTGRDMSAMADKFGLDAAALARLDEISELVSRSRSTLIFANTRQIVEALGSRLLYLNNARSFGGIGVHHSSLDKEERIRIENMFKEGQLKSIVATSSLELGIDIGSVDLVVQYGSPRQALRLLQRVGRSGHTVSGRARGTIIAANIIDAMESYAICRNIEKGALERFAMHDEPVDVLANQTCGIALDKGVCSIDDVLSITRRSYAFISLSREKLDVLLKFMAEQRMIGFDGTTVSSGNRTRMYYYEHLSVIPDTKRFIVRNIANNRIISTLDERFVSSKIDEGSVFITKGLPWRVVSIDNDVLSVEPCDDLEAAVPDWSGEDIPVSREVASGLFDVMNEAGNGAFKGGGYADGVIAKEFVEFAVKQGEELMPSRETLLMEAHDDYSVLYTGLGTLANEALSRLLGHLLSARLGHSINIKASPYSVFVEVQNAEELRNMLLSVKPETLEQTLAGAVTETELFRYRFITVAKLFGLVDRGAVVSKSVAKRLVKMLAGSPVYAETLRELMHNYFDIELLKEFFKKLHSKSIEVRLVGAQKMSPLTNTILNSAYYTKELLMPLTPSGELLNSFVSYMMGKSIKFLCTYCGFSFTRKLEDVKDLGSIACPSCRSPMITPYRDDYKEIVEKRIAGKRTGHGERAVMKEMMQEAGLVNSYGGRAAVALSTYGVGPRTAARALMMFRRDERLFYMDLIDAQKQFIKNKKYWSV